MNHRDLRDMEELCIEEHAPPCTSHCPVHVDVRGMIQKIGEKDIPGAFGLFKKQVLFPGILSRICDSPCENHCNRKDLGGPLAVNALEHYCTRTLEESSPENAAPPVPKPLRKQNRSVAVAGGGLRGLSAALSLYGKGYDVTVFESEDTIGGRLVRLSPDILPPAVLKCDLSVFDHTTVTFRTGTAVEPGGGTEELLSTFDAVIIAFGYTGELSRWHETEIPGIFAAGGRSWSAVTEIASGKSLALSVERYIKKVSFATGRDFEEPYETRLYTNLAGKTATERKETFTGSEEALAEAQRCFRCSCLECVRSCAYLEAFESYPKRYIREISNNLAIVFGIKTAKPLINSCSLCGLCAEVCPNSVDMGRVALHARQEMTRKGSMPPAVHDFPLRDMLFSNDSRALLDRLQPGTEENRYIFFPGCRLSGLQPDHVVAAYSYLTGRLSGGTGIMLGCCGAPARWSGREELFQETISSLRGRWKNLGGGRVITACTTCRGLLREAVPEMETLSLWEVFAEQGLPPAPEGLPEILSVLDPCTSRHEEETRKAVRTVMAGRGVRLEELPYSGVMTKCCGYGGLVLYANRDIAERTVSERLAEGTAPYLAYCSMCREAFAGRDKPVWHLLDLVFGLPYGADPFSKGPGISRQQDNRLLLKKTLLETFWEEGMNEERQEPGLTLYVDPPVAEVLEKRLILLTDIEAVIARAEETGQRLYDEKKERYVAHLKPGIITYWVEYSPERKGYRIHNAYSHRLAIVEDR